MPQVNEYSWILNSFFMLIFMFLMIFMIFFCRESFYQSSKLDYFFFFKLFN